MKGTRLLLAAVLAVFLHSDAFGRYLYVSSLDGRIRRVAPDGTTEVFVEGLNWPHGVAFDANGNLLVADQGRDRIARFAPDGTELAPFTVQINAPVGLDFDHQGNLFVSERSSGDVKKFGPDGTLLGTIATVRGAFDLAVDHEGNVNVGSRSGHVERYTPDGTLLASLTVEPRQGVEGLAFDSANNLYVASQSRENVLRYNHDQTWTVFADGLVDPVGLTFDEHDNLYVAESWSGDDVERFAPDGTYLGTYSSGHGFGLYLAFEPIPEPSTVVLLLVGGLSLAVFARRARR